MLLPWPFQVHQRRSRVRAHLHDVHGMAQGAEANQCEGEGRQEPSRQLVQGQQGMPDPL